MTTTDTAGIDPQHIVITEPVEGSAFPVHLMMIEMIDGVYVPIGLRKPAGSGPFPLVVHAAWHWMLERGELLSRFPFPTLDAAFLASLMRGGIAVLIMVALLWCVSGAVRRLQGKEGMGTEGPARREGLSTPPLAGEGQGGGHATRR